MLSVAIDVETTGFGFKSRDRVVEIAGVVFDLDSGEVVSLFETLINPLRNIPESSTEIHRLTASHLSMAPTFEDFGPWLAHLLGGKRVVGHNVSFDVNFLNSEFERSGIDFQITEYDCTQKLYGGAGLADAVEYLDLEYEKSQHHGALYDAQLCLKLFSRLLQESGHQNTTKVNANFEVASQFRVPSLLTRKQVGLKATTVNEQSSSYFLPRLEIENPVEACYLWRLADFLSDLELTNSEKEQLDLLAADLGLSSLEQVALHTSYVRELEKAALRDGLITETEKTLLEAFANALGVSLQVNLSAAKTEIPPRGSLICVTGTTSIEGVHWGKAEISEFLSAQGFEFTDALNKSDNVALLLQESEGSQSSKVEKARKWGIPRQTIESFVLELSS